LKSKRKPARAKVKGTGRPRKTKGAQGKPAKRMKAKRMKAKRMKAKRMKAKRTKKKEMTDIWSGLKRSNRSFGPTPTVRLPLPPLRSTHSLLVPFCSDGERDVDK